MRVANNSRPALRRVVAILLGVVGVVIISALFLCVMSGLFGRPVPFGGSSKTALPTAEFQFKDYIPPAPAKLNPYELGPWKYATQYGFDWHAARYREMWDEAVWSSNGRWVFLRERNRIVQLSVGEGVGKSQTFFPAQCEMFPSAAGLVLLFRGTSISRKPLGIVVLDEDTLEVKQWHPMSVIGICTSLDSTLAAIAVSDRFWTHEDAVRATAANRIPEKGRLLVADLATGKILASGPLEERFVSSGFRNSYRGHSSMRMALTDQGQAVFTDGDGALIRYQADGSEVKFDRRCEVPTEGKPRSANSSGHVDIWGFTDEYILTSRGLVKSSDPVVILDTKVLAIAPGGWIYRHEKQNLISVKGSDGKVVESMTVPPFEPSMQPGVSDVSPAPKPMLPSFLMWRIVAVWQEPKDRELHRKR